MKDTARLVVMDSVWGHMGELDCPSSPLLHTQDTYVPLFTLIYFFLAGGGSNKRDTDFVVAEIKTFLEE